MEPASSVGVSFFKTPSRGGATRVSFILDFLLIRFSHTDTITPYTHRKEVYYEENGYSTLGPPTYFLHLGSEFTIASYPLGYALWGLDREYSRLRNVLRCALHDMWK